jgi:hypothetical protein
MAQQVLATVLARVGVPPPTEAVELVQYVQVGGRWTPAAQPVTVEDRPPMRTLWAAGETARGTIEP